LPIQVKVPTKKEKRNVSFLKVNKKKSHPIVFHFGAVTYKKRKGTLVSLK
jgi:hypothetical protein